MTLGLWLNGGRVNVRRAYTTAKSIKYALADCLPMEVFTACTDTDEEATAMFNLHKARAESEAKEREEVALRGM